MHVLTKVRAVNEDIAELRHHAYFSGEFSFKRWADREPVQRGVEEFGDGLAWLAQAELAARVSNDARLPWALDNVLILHGSAPELTEQTMPERHKLWQVITAK
jgi:hypothetical protein